MTPLVLLLLGGICFGDMAHDAYASGDAHALRELVPLAQSREDTLLLRYRLYALTQSRGLIFDIPEDLDSASERELALLSALWGYRTQDANLIELAVVGRRTMKLLNRALDVDPNDPLVTLIDAQSLLFRPGIAGGSKERGLERLEQLRTRIASASSCGVTPLEAEVWYWYALEKNGDPRAREISAGLQARDLPPLYRGFLDDPP
jgi:hypothetical protein